MDPRAKIYYLTQMGVNVDKVARNIEFLHEDGARFEAVFGKRAPTAEDLKDITEEQCADCDAEVMFARKRRAEPELIQLLAKAYAKADTNLTAETAAAAVKADFKTAFLNR